MNGLEKNLKVVLEVSELKYGYLVWIKKVNPKTRNIETAEAFALENRKDVLDLITKTLK